MDALAGFRYPPEGYGEVAFYWWVGERLDRNRLEWQLHQLKDHHITALQINYAHGDVGGLSYGLTYPSDPPLFSEEWWELFNWFAQKAGEYGIAVSLSDYTLCTPGQGSYADEILSKNPDLAGSILKHWSWNVDENLSLWKLPAHTLSVMAVREDEGSPAEAINLSSYVQGESLQWTKPEGYWRITAVYLEARPMSIDPTHPCSGELVIEHFFKRFEHRLQNVPGARLGFFFSDELDFGLKGFIWSEKLRYAFILHKGYDPLPELAALFVDIGPRTTKIRLDYGDVMVGMSEDHYFKPVFNWHESRGLIYGCDHGGRGKNPIEFGDYFRTQRWNQGPGCDQPNLECDLIKNKVASSIAHLYERPRTWLEGFYGSGWGTTTAELADAIFRNFVSGHNLLTLHGLYYTTYGGWWEWAPPCNHFRMPYWKHMQSLMECTERLSYLLSQGHHVCDIAVIYPVASLEAGIYGDLALTTAFEAADSLYKQGIDFDFIDHQSMERANVDQGRLTVAGESYKVLVLPAMRALRQTTLRKALEFFCSGGIVIAIGSLPEASDRAGSSDPELNKMVRQLFGWTAVEATENGGNLTNRHLSGGLAKTVWHWKDAVQVIEEAFPRDFYCEGTPDTPEAFPYIQHRKIGQRDLYAVYNVPRGTECFFRCHGSVEIWNPWDGSNTPVSAQRVDPKGTWICLPMDQKEIQLVVFTPDPEALTSRIISVPITQREKKPSRILPLVNDWFFLLRPTMDNQFGDFRQPVSDTVIGAEVRILRFAWEKDKTAAADWHYPKLDDSSWQPMELGNGPFFWKLGPLPLEKCTKEQEHLWATLDQPPCKIQGAPEHWTLYEFSTRYGIAGDPGHQGYHGLKGNVSDAFLTWGRPVPTLTGMRYEPEEAGEVYYFWSTVVSLESQYVKLHLSEQRPDRIWLNGIPIQSADNNLWLNAGHNILLARYIGTGRGYLMFDTAANANHTQTLPLAMSWYNQAAFLSFDALPQRGEMACWYRFTAPPGLKSLELTAHGQIEVWIDGNVCQVKPIGQRDEGATRYQVTLTEPVLPISTVAIRLIPSRGFYAGAAIPEPIQFQCFEGLIKLGDWSEIDGLRCYSGEAIYRKHIHWQPKSSPERVVLQLGNISSTAAISINGRHVRTLLQPPWDVDLTQYFQHPGDYAIEVSVCNTLANHYATIPTRYGGETVSGLLGPVALVIYDDEQDLLFNQTSGILTEKKY